MRQLILGYLFLVMMSLPGMAKDETYYCFNPKYVNAYSNYVEANQKYLNPSNRCATEYDLEAYEISKNIYDKAQIIYSERREILTSKFKSGEIRGSEQASLFHKETDKMIADLMSKDNLRAELKNTKNKENLVLLLEKNLVNKEKFPRINENNSTKITKLNNFSNEQINDFKKNYSKVAILIPKDFIVNSLIVNKETQRSEYAAGTSTIPNDEYARLQRYYYELQRGIDSRENELRNFPQNKSCQNPELAWACALGDILGTYSKGKIVDEINEMQNELIRTRRALNNTPQYIKQNIYRPYEFVVETIESKKEVKYDFISIQGEVIEKANIKFEDVKKFEVASGLSLEDKFFRSLDNKFSKRNTIESWENGPIREISISELNTIYNNSKKSNINKRDLNALIANEDKKIASNIIDRKSNTQINQNISNVAKNEDKRFGSVVVVRTNSGLGTGFYISNNQIITNYHVVEKANNISIENFKGEKSSVKIVKQDLQRDMVLLETNLKGQPVKLYNKAIQIGIPVEAIGHPRGLNFSVSRGVVSGVRQMDSTYSFSKNRNTLFVQTDAAINPGNSGGPLFYETFVIGINTQGLKKNETEGLNFAVHYDEIKNFIKN